VMLLELLLELLAPILNTWLLLQLAFPNIKQSKHFHLTTVTSVSKPNNLKI
jgi:hypothetical protein